MHNLAELQKNFQAYLSRQPSKIKTAIVKTKNVSVVERLEIYRDAYYARLMEALCQDYTVLHALIGDKKMQKLTHQYIDLYPSGFRSIRWYGKNLPIFMRETFLYSKAPWLIELAEFEWALSETFDAKDSGCFPIEKMANIPPSHWHNLQFEIHPSIQRLKLTWNVAEVWNIFTEKNKLVTPLKTPEMENWIIWRKDQDIQFCSLIEKERYVLEAMASHENFGCICEGLCQWMDETEVALYAASVLKRFIIDGIIIGVRLN